METSGAAMRRAWKLQICPFETARFAGAISWSVRHRSNLLADERRHGNKILKDEQHLFTREGLPEITKKKRDF
jgi:hypothetical protein